MDEGTARSTATSVVVTVLLVGAAALATASYLLDAPAALRVPATLTFLLVCPGAALVRLIAIPSVAMAACLAVALSLAVDEAVAMVAMYGGAWSPGACLLVLAVLTTGLAVLPHARAAVPRRPGGQHVRSAR